ncbi:DUF6049 family protein [Nocardiopsis sp. HUAS JQ3]|uniref:DUF6049 family protein n=1 Tax=Nocardiopsis sp. HUAS JQ3 TaxID=3061629 RepID=UPI0023AA0A99|nr:DUF6049 family protein [Nocardiopsis sp. HUAS JQ3]WDZ90993.1 DUF6049 family protein [Nocardiopsis sp. HUAS JQ3]
MAFTTALLPIPATSANAEQTADPLVVERVTPDAADEDSTLRVTGEVTNTTSEDLSDVSVRLSYSRNPFSDRGELDEFASGEGWQPDTPGPDEEVTAELAPEASAEYSLSVPVEDLGLDSYGVYPLVVEAVDGDGRVVGSQYTFLPYTGGDDAPSVDIAWVWPLMAPPRRADEDTFLNDDLHSSVAADGRLGRLLAAGAQAPVSFEAGEEDLVELLGLNEESEESAEPSEGTATAEETAEALPTEEATEEGAENAEDEDEPAEEATERDEGVPVTWAVDPGTLDDVLRMASSGHSVVEDPLAVPAESEPVRHQVETSEAAQVWLREARRVLAADHVVATPYARADLAALLRHDMGSDAEAALRVGQEAVLRALETEADGTFALPPNGLMDRGVHELLASHGATRFLLDEKALSAASWLSTTPTAQAPLPAPEEETSEEPFALVADQGITDVLSMPTGEPGQSELALQRFAAETAMIAGENAGGGRVVVASPEPHWNPSAEFAQGVLAASEDLPWLSPRSLDEVELPEAGERERTRRSLTYPDSAYGEELSSTYLGLVEDVSQDVRLFNSVLVGDSDPLRPALLRLESVYWREEEALAGATRAMVDQDVQDRMNDVRVIPGEPVTLASRTGTTGVLVANDLEEETVSVNLSVFSENSDRLSVGEYNHSFELEPGTRITVYIPLSARVNGRTVIDVGLQNSEGEPISSQDVEIPVHATGLSTQALAISGIGVLILAAALAPRALRKWARGKAAAAASETDGTAEAPEAADSSGTAAGADPDGANAGDSAGVTHSGSPSGNESSGTDRDTAPDTSEGPSSTEDASPDRDTAPDGEADGAEDTERPEDPSGQEKADSPAAAGGTERDRDGKGT